MPIPAQMLTLDCWKNALHATRSLDYYKNNWDRGDVQDEAIDAQMDIGDLLYSLPMEKMLKVKPSLSVRDYVRANDINSPMIEEIKMVIEPSEQLLLYACRYGDVETVARCLDAKINTRYALLAATANNKLEVVRLLLEHGVVDLQSLYYAATHNLTDIVAEMLNAGISDRASTAAAVRSGNAEMIELFIAYGQVTDARLLDIPVSVNDLETTRLLLDCGLRCQYVRSLSHSEDMTALLEEYA